MTEARIDGRRTMIIKPVLCNLESVVILRYGPSVV
jgi:hypothetical protein